MLGNPWCIVLAAFALTGCTNPLSSHSSVQADSTPKVVAEPLSSLAIHHIRATGTVVAVRASNVVVPSLRGPGGRLTLLHLIPNGSKVEAKMVIAEFDHVQQEDDARDARARLDDLNHQIDQNRAQARADAARRNVDLRQAEADLGKAKIELRKGEALSEIDRLKNQAKLEDTQAKVDSLKKSSAYRDQADAAGVRILELQAERRQVALERAMGNLDKLELKAPIAGMVAHENVFRNGSRGPMQEGDQAFPGQPLLRIFDPSEMVVLTLISETDNAVITPGAQAKVRLDAYPGVVFDAYFESASPVASTDLGSPIKTFSAKFKIAQRDARLLPDLSAAVELAVPARATQAGEGKK